MTPTCPAHPELPAHATCSRCGSYACETCTAAGLRSEPLCNECDALVVQEHQRKVLRWGRLFVVGLAFELLTNTALLVSASLANNPVWGVSALSATYFTALCHVFWFRRANRAVAARKVALNYGPNAWLWYFVPFANWICPYQAHSELYEWVYPEAGLELPAWWTCSVLAGFLGAPALFGAAGPFRDWCSTLSTGLQVVEGLLLILVITRFTKHFSTPRERMATSDIGPVATNLFAEFR